MKIKEREIPERIVLLRRLLIRMLDNCPSRSKFKFELKNLEKGYFAECELDSFLDRIGINSTKCMVIQDLRLPSSGKGFFQIDYLLLTLHFALIIEVKSQGGIFSFHNNARNFQYEKYDMEHPILQVEEQKDQLQKKLDLKDYPVESVVALYDPKAIVETDESSKWIHDRFMHFGFLKSTIKNISLKYPETVLAVGELAQLSRNLVKSHCPQILDWKNLFNVERQYISPGVICPNCHHLPMKRLRVWWECPHCRSRFKNAHVDGLRDYLCLINNIITNKACREFLLIDNVHTARTLMQKSGILEWKGKNSGRVYWLKRDK